MALAKNESVLAKANPIIDSFSPAKAGGNSKLSMCLIVYDNFFKRKTTSPDRHQMIFSLHQL